MAENHGFIWKSYVGLLTQGLAAVAAIPGVGVVCFLNGGTKGGGYLVLTKQK